MDIADILWPKALSNLHLSLYIYNLDWISVKVMFFFFLHSLIECYITVFLQSLTRICLFWAGVEGFDWSKKALYQYKYDIKQ